MSVIYTQTLNIIKDIPAVRAGAYVCIKGSHKQLVSLQPKAQTHKTKSHFTESPPEMKCHFFLLASGGLPLDSLCVDPCRMTHLVMFKSEGGMERLYK